MSALVVSVIMPVYNGERFVREAITSFLNQRYEWMELVVVNDGSFDTTEQIVKEFKDDKIKYFFQENKGVSAARNKGLENCSGDLICFLDADDELPPDTIKSRVEKFSDNPRLGFLEGKVAIFSENMQELKHTYVPVKSEDILSELIEITGSCFMGPSWMIRRSEIKHDFNTNITHGEDLLFYIENLNESDMDFEVIDQVVLKYRKNNFSAMNNIAGLERGYRYIYKVLEEKCIGTAHSRNIFKKKTSSIIFRSYAKSGKYAKAIKSVLNR